MQFDNYLLRKPKPADAVKYFEMIEYNRTRLEDCFAGTLSKTRTLADTENFLADMMKRIEAKSYMSFLIVDTNTDTLMGYIDVKNIDWNLPKAELGCYLDSRYVGKGVSKKALLMVINYLLDELHFNKIFLRTSPNNKPARALAESCGFEQEGLLRKDYKTTKGEIVDLIYYGLVKQ